MEHATAAPPRRRLRREQRVDQLLDAAEQVFVDVGYEAASMADIARAAAVTRPVVYEHFREKSDLYLGCVRRARAAFHSRLAEALVGLDDPYDQLRRGTDVYLQVLQEDPRRWELLFGPSTLTSGSFAVELGKERQATISLIADLLQVHASHLPRPHLELLAHVVSGAGEQVARWWLRHPEQEREDVLTWYLATLWAGLAVHVLPATT